MIPLRETTIDASLYCAQHWESRGEVERAEKHLDFLIRHGVEVKWMNGILEWHGAYLDEDGSRRSKIIGEQVASA